MPTIVITGAAGRIGTMLRPRLARPDRGLRLLDIAPVPDVTPAEEAIVASVTDLAAMTSAFDGADAVIHLGGIAREAAWERILDVNINGTYVALEAARRAGVRRVVLASSNHAVGFAPLGGDPVPDYLFPRPDTFYGVSKATMEALGSLYHDRHGMDVICLRILSCFERPKDVRMLSTWLSPDDAGRLFDACLTAPDPGSASPTAFPRTRAAAWYPSTKHGPSAMSHSTTPSSTRRRSWRSSPSPTPRAQCAAS